ncbi:MAG: FecR family protein [Dysgonamonadaceae bacterium]|nr:FecR family protein [Dysgonamonadaceae bacterium]
MKKYRDYKCIDFLDDDSFIRAQTTMNPEDCALWNSLIDNCEIDIDEFLEANLMLEAWMNTQQEPDAEQLNDLRIKIAKSIEQAQKAGKRTRIKKLLILSATAVGTVAAVVACLFYFPLNNKQQTPPSEYTQFRIINQEQPSDVIRLSSGNEEMKIDEANPQVSYDSNGTLKINRKVIDLKTAKPAATTENPAMNRLWVPFGKRAQLTLSDGSHIWINTGTVVVYPERFVGEAREIYVDGEIYVDVAKSDDKPFIVKTNAMEISVLGTKFNVAAYSRDNISQVALVEGSVKVRQNENDLNLEPGQVFTTTSEGNSLKTTDTEIYTSWKNGIYILDNEPIEKILLKLARYYNVTMTLPEKESGTICFGKLKLRDELDPLMKNLSQIARFNYAVKDNRYTIQYIDDE